MYDHVDYSDDDLEVGQPEIQCLKQLHVFSEQQK